MITILDVVDGFFHRDIDILTVPGKTLYEFGVEVQRFADAYQPPALGAEERVAYIGGWPSANIWLAQPGGLTMTSLLYVDRVLGRDPLADWFAPERYEVQTLLSCRPGYRDEFGNALVAHTRRFLASAIAGLQSMRALIESGVVELVPSRRFIAEEQNAISVLGDELVERVLGDPLEFSRRFNAADLAVEDNVRGMFVLAGGDRPAQIRKAVSRATEFFAGEYLLASAYGATYTAPFPLERYMAEIGLASSFKRPGDRVVHALIRTRFPLFRDLTPAIVASVRDDDSFGEVRATIYNLYRDISPQLPEDQVSAAIGEAERTLLSPIVSKLEANAQRGPLSKSLRFIRGHTFRVGLGLLVSQAISPGPVLPSLAAGSLSDAGTSALDRIRHRRRPNPLRGWQTLFEHSRCVEQEVSLSKPLPQPNDWWAMPELPNMELTVTSGQLIGDFLPSFPLPEATGTKIARNSPCSCGSGRKFKACCLGITQP